MQVTLARPWIVAEFGGPLRVLSWALNRPGFRTARRAVWREVRDDDLTETFDADSWFRAELARAGHAEAIGFLTSRDVRRLHHTRSAGAEALATVGLSNAERVGARRAAPALAGTINILVQIAAPLTQAALIEALSIAAEARTAAILDHGPGDVTGTGTDCIAVAAPPGGERFAGKHTGTGEAVGRAVYDAVAAGAAEWVAER